MSPAPRIARDMLLEIIYEDNHLIGVEKPAGQLTQGDRSGSVSLLDSIKEHIRMRDKKPGNVFLGMVQRLDKPVSGAIVFAKTSKAASRLSESIRKREVTKLYLALTELRSRDNLQPGDWREHRHLLLRSGAKTVVCSAENEHSQHGVLQIRTLIANEVYACHLIRLITGRKHQIRAQLSHLGLPIVGDTKYGSSTQYGADGIGLHAFSLELAHPVKKDVLRIVSPPPPSFFPFFNEQDSLALRQEIDKIQNRGQTTFF